MELKNFPQIAWILLLPVFYTLPFLADKGGALAIVALLPFIICVAVYLTANNVEVKTKNFLVLFFFIFSNFINFYYDSNLTGMISSPLLFLFLITSINIRNITINDLNEISKMIFIGFILMFVFIIFLPLITNFPYKIGAWYLIASDTFPLLRTTLDGPFSLVVTGAIVYVFYKYTRKQFVKIVLFIIIIAVDFYTLLVFNRRTMIAYSLITFPFILRNWGSKTYVFRLVFLLSFLLPIFFATFLFYVKELSSISFIHQLTLRSKDLNAEDNQRLIGWIKALTAYRSSGPADFFKFHKVLVRSDNPRYNTFHNGYIQIYYEQGIFGFGMLLVLIVNIIRKIKYFKYIKFRENKYLALWPFIFALILIVSVTEASFRDLILTNVFFITTCFFMTKMAEIAKHQNMVIVPEIDTEQQEDTSNQLAEMHSS